MAKRQTSQHVSSLAARVLAGYEPTRAEIPTLAASVLSQDETKGNRAPEGKLPSGWPEFIYQTDFQSTDDVRPWLLEHSDHARAQGATWMRASHHPEIPGRVLLEGWKVRPEDEGKPRWVEADVEEESR